MVLSESCASCTQNSPPPAVILVIFDLVTEKGYCLVEFEKKEEAELAIAEMDGSQLLEQEISVMWAFVRGAFIRPCCYRVSAYVYTTVPRRYADPPLRQCATLEQSPRSYPPAAAHV